MIVRTYGAALALQVVLSGVSTAATLAEPFPKQGQVVAAYDVTLAGLSLGELHLNAKFKGLSYRIQGDGQFSLFFGQFYKSGGEAASAGQLGTAGPEPGSFTVSYEGGGKGEERRISFNGGEVKDVTITPKSKPGRGHVPVTQEQLRDVLDPLSAAFLHTQNGDSVCHGTMPIFDGRLRYDIALTPKRVEALPAKAPSGLSHSVDICTVKFMPVSGHKPDNTVIKFLSSTDRIEAWLVQLPNTDLYVPYWIGVPTIIGSASVTLTRIDVKPN